MRDPLRQLLATKSVLLADGAMGTSLFAQGLATGDAPELWNLTEGARVRVGIGWGLWDVVNELTRLRRSRRDNYRVFSRLLGKDFPRTIEDLERLGRT